MKKLMIAAAIVCAAAFAQATTVTWGMTKIYDGNATDKVTGLGYLFGSVQNIGEEGKAVTLTAADIILALEGNGTEEVTDWLSKVTKITTSASNGSMSHTAYDTDATAAGLVANGAQQTLFALIFDTESIGDASKFYVTEKAQVVGLNGNAAFPFSSQETASQKAANWHAVSAVPEPTSGLLLLLGVAGLALRRRHA